MSIDICDPILDALGDLGDLYPDMRFGQIIEMVALFCGADPASIEDEQLLDVAMDHARNRRRQLAGVGDHGWGQGLLKSRTELLSVLQIARDLKRGRRLGEIVTALARNAEVSLYDAEDQELIAAARGLAAGAKPVDPSP